MTAKVIKEVRENRYDSSTDTHTLTEAQVQALKAVGEFWEKTFKDGEKGHGFLPNTVKIAEERLEMARFFFWTAWVASTKRPDSEVTYTNNWPAA